MSTEPDRVVVDEPLLSRAEVQEIEARFKRHINEGQVKYLKAGHLDVIESQRRGVRFVDSVTGRPMFDCFSSAGSFNVSRHNPEVMAALEAALDEVDMGTSGLVSEHKVAFARKLLSLCPGDINRMLFAAGGGDAIDCAIKLARGATGRPGVLCTAKAYHGHTGFALSANGKAHYRHYCEPLMPGFSFVPFNDLQAMRAAASREETAAILIEPVQGEAGIFVGDDDYLRGLRELCDEIGALLIFDEIQTGFGRTGRLFASEHSGVVPDIMTLGKSLGGGLFPSAAMVYRDVDLLTDFVEANPDFHPSCAGGSDLACRCSLQVLEYVNEERLWENSERMGRRLKVALEELQRRNPKIIKAVRGVGLMVGIEYIHEFLGPMMSDALAKHGVFAAYSGNAPQVMRFMPPITINAEELELLIEAIGAAVREMKTLLPLTLPAARIPVLLKLLNSEKVQTSLFGMIRKVEDGVGALGRRLRRG